MAIQFKNLVDVFEQRTGAVATDAYTLTVSTEQTSGATPNPGTGGLKVQYYSVSSGTTHGFGLVAGSSSSDFLTSGPMHFYTNSDLDTKNATGFAMVLDTSQRLGIGITSPTQKLDVNGNVNVGGAFSGVIYFSQTTTGPRIVGTNPSLGGQLDLFTGNVLDPRIRITSAGDVGIGTTSPTTPVEIVNSDNTLLYLNSSTANVYLRLDDSNSTNGNFIGATTDDMHFWTNNTERMRIDSSGNVLINRTGTSGLGKLNVEGGADFTGGNVLLCRDTGDVGVGVQTPAQKLHVAGNVGIDESIIHNGDTDTKIGFVANDNFAITTAGVERVRVTSGGSVGIATNNPGAKLDVEGNAVIGSSGNTVTGDYAVALNQNNTASSLDALATGENTTASGRQSFSGGFNTTASGDASFAVGASTTASQNQSFAAGAETNAAGIASAAFNALTDATGVNSFAINGDTTASGESSFSLGVGGNAQGLGSISAGLSCNTGGSANGAFAGGTASNANGQFSIAFGDVANASGRVSQALGYIVNATGQYSFAANFNNTVNGTASAVFGQQNLSTGTAAWSLSTGFLNTTRDSASLTVGSFNGLTASNASREQFMLGRYLNVPRDSSGNPSAGCLVVGEHNAYSNRPNVKFAVGTGVGVGAEQDSFTVLKDGNVLMEQIVNKNYSSDSAAAAGGVPVGGIYHNSGDLKIRLT